MELFRFDIRDFERSCVSMLHYHEQVEFVVLGEIIRNTRKTLGVFDIDNDEILVWAHKRRTELSTKHDTMQIEFDKS